MGESARARLIAGLLCFGVAATLLSAAAAAGARPMRGVLDRSFGHNGRVFSEMGDAFASSEFTAVVRQPDDKFVLTANVETAERGSAGMIQRRLPDGRLDANFGSGGTVLAPEAGYLSSVKGLALQEDGRILFSVPGTQGPCAAGSTVYGLQPNGNLDSSFGNGGASASLPLSASYIAIDSKGRILVAGVALYNCVKFTANRELAVARLEPNGNLDSSFGNEGVVHANTEDKLEESTANGLAVREDGTILVAGSRSLLALSSGGALESSFGKGGVAEAANGPKVLLALSGGEAILASSESCCSGTGDFVLSRYRADGSLNTEFGSGGRTSLDVGAFDEASALALAPDGSIVLAGGAASPESCGGGECPFTPILARFDSDGALDSGFGQGGRTPLEFPGGSPGYTYVPRIAGLAISPSGQILAAGGAGRRSDAFVLARGPNGGADPSFGSLGSVGEIRTVPSITEALGLAIGPSGDILTSAWSDSGAHSARTVLLSSRPIGDIDTEVGSGSRFVVSETDSEIRADGHNRYYSVAGAGGARGRAYIARFDDRGRRDPHYGSQGAARLPAHFDIGSLAVRRSGEALVVGRIAHRFGMAAFKLTPQGRPDRRFGRDGLALIGFGRGVKAMALSAAFDRQGRVVLFGNEGPYAGMARLLPNGRPDLDFAYHGRQPYMPGLANEESAVAIAPDGGILIAAAPEAELTPLPTTLIRFRRDGIRDRTFGHNGLVRVHAGAPMVGFFGGRRIILVSGNGLFGENGVAIRAFRGDGRADLHFGRHGVVIAARAQSRPFRPVAAARQPGGRLVIAGTAGKIEEPGASVEILRFR